LRAENFTGFPVFSALQARTGRDLNPAERGAGRILIGVLER